MRQPPTPAEELHDLDKITQDACKELARLRDLIEHHTRRRDDILSTVLSTDLDGYKLVSFRLAAQVSGVPHQTLYRRYA